MKRIVSIKIQLILYLFLMTFTFSYVQGEQISHKVFNIHELNVEKDNLEKLQSQLQILETKEDVGIQNQTTRFQVRGQDNSKQGNKPPILINPNENILLKKEMGEYDVQVYSIDATQVTVADVLQALSASFGKSIIVDDEVDPAYLASYINISIQKSPLQDILEVVLGMRGLEFVQNEDSIFVTSLAKLNIDTAFEYYRDKSIHLYQKAQIKYPNDPRIVKAYFELGNYYYDLGFNFLALQEYQIIVRKYRGSPQAKESLFKIGRCYDRLKDSESARRAYFQFLCSYPKDLLVADALLSIGDSLMEQGLYNKALDIYEKVIREFANDDSGATTKAQFSIAKAYMKMGEYRNAIQVFLKARWKYCSDQRRAEIEYQIGNCLYLLNEYQDASNVLGNYLVNEEEGEFGENAIFLLGDCFYKLDNYLGAFQIFRKATERYSKSNKVPGGIYCMGKSLRAMNMPESAIKILREGLQAFPVDDTAGKMAFEIGMCYFDKGDYCLAYNAFDSFVKQYPQDELVVEAMIVMSDALLNDKKYVEATNSYFGLLKTSNSDDIRRYAFNRIGECYKYMGKLQQAIKAYQIGLRNTTDAVQIAWPTDDSLGTNTSIAFH
jgi:TolA-binding protein